MNWEGHDEWPETIETLALRNGVAPAIKSKLPSCSERRENQKENAYEQAAIAGENCIE